MDYTLPEFIELFNSGDFDVEKYFNDYETFFKILDKRGLLPELDPIYGSGSEHWQNEYLIWLYNNDQKEKFRHWVSKLLDDVVFDENGNAYLEVSYRADLADLFCDNRRGDVSRDTIENILRGEDAFEAYNDTTQDVYDDVLEELSEKNIKIFLSRMVDELKGKQLYPETEEMESIASEQGHEDYWELNEENAARIFDDKESMNSLLDDELSEFKSNLYSIHSYAYNSAFESDVIDEIFDELGEYFTGKGEWSSKPHPFKKHTTLETFKIPFNNFYNLILDYLESNKPYGNSGTLEYHGRILSLMKEEFDCLSIRVPDYPDFRKVDENINSYFLDYF